MKSPGNDRNSAVRICVEVASLETEGSPSKCRLDKHCRYKT